MNFFTLLAERQQTDLFPFDLKLLFRSIFRFIMQLRLAFFIILTTSIQLFSAPPVKSQAIDKVEISLELKNESLIKAFQKIEKQSPFQFMYRLADVRDINKLEMPTAKMSVAEVLNQLLANTSLEYKQVDNRILIMATQNKLAVKTSANALDVVVRGQVTDAKGETLPGVSVKVKGTDIGASTDIDGKYSLNVPDNATLVFTYICYVTKEVTVNGQTVVNVTLDPTST